MSTKRRRPPLPPCDTLRGYREQAAMTQREVASLLGCDYRHYGHIECGERSLTAHHAAVLQWHLGWDVRPDDRASVTNEPNPTCEQARLVAMMALCAYGGAVPKGWRQDVVLHRKAIREWMRQFGERRRAVA